MTAAPPRTRAVMAKSLSVGDKIVTHFHDGAGEASITGIERTRSGKSVRLTLQENGKRGLTHWTPRVDTKVSRIVPPKTRAMAKTTDRKAAPDKPLSGPALAEDELRKANR